MSSSLMEVAPLIDLEILVENMPDLECEHPQHHRIFSDAFHDTGPAKYYYKRVCIGCGFLGVLPICGKFANAVRAGMSYRCRNCGSSGNYSPTQILGPVGG